MIEINTEMGDLNCKYGFYSINPESQLNLHRNWLYKEDTGPDIYRDGKKVSKAENEQIQDHVLNSETRWSIKLESYQVYEDEVQGPNHPIIDQLSEDIADTMDIPLIDHTGVETISSDPNNLNISLINKLKEEGVTPIDENDEKLNNLPIFEKNGKFVIEETSISYFNILYNIFVSIIFLTLFGISLISILQLITQNLIVTYSLPQELYYFGAIIFPHSVLGFLKRFNGIRKKHLISIDKDGVHEVQARLILNHKPWNLPLDEIEHLHIVDGPDERKLLEFIADRGRIILSNLMEEDQVIEMKSALQKIILYLGNGK